MSNDETSIVNPLETPEHRIFLKTRDSVYLSCNVTYARDLGITPQDIRGKTDFDFYPTMLAEKYRSDDERVMASGASFIVSSMALQVFSRLVR